MEGWVARGWACLDSHVMPEDQEPGALVGVRSTGVRPESTTHAHVPGLHLPIGAVETMSLWHTGDRCLAARLG